MRVQDVDTLYEYGRLVRVHGLSVVLFAVALKHLLLLVSLEAILAVLPPLSSQNAQPLSCSYDVFRIPRTT